MSKSIQNAIAAESASSLSSAGFEPDVLDEKRKSQPVQLSHQSIDEYKSEVDARSTKVAKLLNDITKVNADNAASGLVDYAPRLVDYAPRLAQSHERVFAGVNPRAQQRPHAADPVPSEPHPLLPNPGLAINRRQGGGVAQIGYAPSRGEYLGKRPEMGSPYFSRREGMHPSAQPTSHDDKLLEKINYMIHLLEEQRMEKTSNVMEEFVLYTMLGVFVIYVADTFTRVGKYTR